MSNSSTAGWVTGWIAFFILGAYVFSENVTNVFGLHDLDPDAIYCEGDPNKQKTNDAAPASAITDNQTLTQTNQSSSRSSANCIQWRATVAAETQARYTKFGFWLLVPTLLATAFAAVAGWRTIGTMQTTARRELRAYVSFICRGITNLGTTHPIVWDCLVENHGATPAFKINYVFDIGVFPDPLLQGFKFPAPTTAVAYNAPLFPGVETTVQLSTRPLTTIEHANAMAGTHRLHVWGTMTYEDIFQTSRPTTLHISAGGTDFICALAAVAAGRPAPPFKFFHGAQHNQIREDGAD
jgi:hypothetical protein